MKAGHGTWTVLVLSLPLVAGLWMAAGCGGSVQSPDTTGASAQTLRSDLPRDLTPDPSATDLAGLVEGNHRFALAVYHSTLSESEGGNVLISPLSIRMAFAMAYAGARGRTETEMADVLCFDLGQAALHNAMNALDLALQARNDPGADPTEGPVELHIANAFWGRVGYPFRAEYLDLLAVHYGSGIETLDFARAPDPCRLIINAWVAQKTRDRILDLLPPGSIDPLTVAVITNAVYFKAPWAAPFDEEMTTRGDFHRLDGRTTAPLMMHGVSPVGYAEDGDVQAVELPYRGEELSMVVILPGSGRFEAFESGLGAERLSEVLDALRVERVAVTLPTFTFESTFGLKDKMSAMGMPTAFTGSADFSRMVDGGGIYMDEAYHKTFIGVDEKGTEAAAATAIVFRETSWNPHADYAFTADRPFMFLIRDRLTGVILFVGRVMDPSE